MSNSFYNPNVPLVSTPFADWQVLFQRNFEQLSEAFKVNHVSLESSANAGNHNYIELVEQPTETSIQTNASEVAIYTRNVEGTTDQVFMRYRFNGQEVPISNYQLYQIKETDAQSSYFSTLPGGLICYFGTAKKTTKSNKIEKTEIEILPKVAKNIVSINITNFLPTSPFQNVNIATVDGYVGYVAITTVIPTVPSEKYYFIVGNL